MQKNAPVAIRYAEEHVKEEACSQVERVLNMRDEAIGSTGRERGEGGDDDGWGYAQS